LSSTEAPWRLRLIVFLLRLAGAVTCCAFFAMFLPTDWMAATHARLGLGEFPRSALVDYLIRSVAALYGFHGCLLFVISTDPVKYRALVWYVAAMNVLFGVIMVAVDLHAGMPLPWTLAEGPPIAMMGVALGVLNWQATAAPAVQLAGR
jgi:hypothetical protein